MMRADVHHTNLMDLVAQVKAGYWVTLEENGKSIAAVVPPSAVDVPFSPHSSNLESTEDRKPGIMKGKIHVKDNFDDPLPDEILAYFGMVK